MLNARYALGGVDNNVHQVEERLHVKLRDAISQTVIASGKNDHFSKIGIDHSGMELDSLHKRQVTPANHKHQIMVDCLEILSQVSEPNVVVFGVLELRNTTLRTIETIGHLGLRNALRRPECEKVMRDEFPNGILPNSVRQFIIT